MCAHDTSPCVDPLVTVIVPAYNHEKYIEACLQSIARQTHPAMQVIIFDDGSRDRTREVISSFLSSNTRPGFEFHPKENEGLCATLNRGLAMATGKYLAIIASDDEWMPNKLAVQVELLEQNPTIGLVFTDAVMFTEQSDKLQLWSDYKTILKTTAIFETIDMLNIYKKLLIHTFIPALTVMTRKSVIDKVGPFDTSIAYEDDDMWLRIALENPIAYINSPLAKYRLHATNISNNSFFMLKGYVQTLAKHLKAPPLRDRPIQSLTIVLTAARHILGSKIRKTILRWSGKAAI